MRIFRGFRRLVGFMRPLKLSSGDTGFTLIEVVIGSTIMVAVLSVMLVVALKGRFMASQGEHALAVMNILQHYMEEEKQKGFNSIQSHGPHIVTIDGMGTEGSADDLTGEINVFVATSGSLAKYKTVTVIIIWDVPNINGARAMERSIKTNITDFE